jgi:hypothetical protein
VAKRTQVFPDAAARVSLELEKRIPIPYSVKVGIRGAKGEAVKQVHEGAPASTLTVVEVATYHEFGMGNNPERSFLRAWVDLNRTKVQEMMRTLGKKLIAQAADIVGLFAQSGIQEYISTGPFAELKRATIRRKNSSQPLIDTGQLRSSVTYETKVNEAPKPTGAL